MNADAPLLGRVRWVCFDVGETLIDETRQWAGWADWLGVTHLTFFAALGATIAGQRDHHEVFQLLRPGFDLAAARAARVAAGQAEAFGVTDLYPDVRSTLAQLRTSGLRIAIAGNQPLWAEAALATIGLPLGSTEQHAYLSLSTDSILAERVAAEAAEPLGVPVFPVVAYGITPSFCAYPGTISLRVETYLRLVRDILDGLHGQGFRRLVVVNGHGGNTPAQALVDEWLADHGDAQVKWHNWWNAPEVWAQVQATDVVASHASWMENFPWTRLEGVTQPGHQKTPVDVAALRQRGPAAVRAGLGDGNFAGVYQRSDAEMLAIWDVAVAETRAIIERSWA
jgi:creatinine amidohydrolase